MPAAPAAVVGAPDVVAPLRVSVLGPVRAWWGERELNLGLFASCVRKRPQ